MPPRLYLGLGTSLMAARVGPDEYRCPPPRGCGKIKPRSAFYAPRTKSTEVSHYCKVCQSRHAREARRRQAELAYD